MKSKETLIDQEQILPVLFILGRFLLLLSTFPVLQVVNQDIRVYFETGALPGWPYFNYWVEYPPLFAFFNALFYRAFGFSGLVFTFIYHMVLGLAGAAVIYFFQKFAKRIHGEDGWFTRSILLTLILTPLSYTWQYFDMIPLLLIFLALDALFERKTISAGVWIAVGILTKWFPALLLPMVWRFRPRRQAVIITAISLGITAVVCGGLWISSPEITKASLFTQPGRSSWQTVWAILDGNYFNGHIADALEHLDISIAARKVGNPAQIPSWATLLVFGGLGFWALLRVRRLDDLSAVAFFGATWGIYLLWSIGWSPQWILYLLPLLLLTLPPRQGLFYCTAIVLLTVFEWPLLLRVSPFFGTIIIAPLRSMLLILFTITWLGQTRTLPAAELPPRQ